MTAPATHCYCKVINAIVFMWIFPLTCEMYVITV